ncbi:hypothetical protein MBLNU230_g6446t1 [Neophaeotheca triangularis]
MDYFDHARGTGNQTSEDRLNAPLPNTPGPSTPGGRSENWPLPRQPSSRGNLRPYSGMRTPSSIGIRRLGSNTPSTALPPAQAQQNADEAAAARRRSSSAPQKYRPSSGTDTELARISTADPPMGTLSEEPAYGQQGRGRGYRGPEEESDPPQESSINVDGLQGGDRFSGGAGAMHSAGNAARSNRGLRRFRSTINPQQQDRQEQSRPDTGEYEDDVVDLLDIVDPEVSTLGTLNNVQNSLFVPDLGSWINRRPTYKLTQRPSDMDATLRQGQRSRRGTVGSMRPRSGADTLSKLEEGVATDGDGTGLDNQGRRISLTSELQKDHYAVLPHGWDLSDWTAEERAELDDHVRHQLHSRREGFKRSMKGFGKYCSKPLGLFVVIYATLVTLFGAAWVFALIGWIYVGDEQDYIINVIDLVLVALFALIGDGLAPFRAVDTYHMCFIAHYHYLTWRLRREKELPDLPDQNDLPFRRRAREQDILNAIDKGEIDADSVLTPHQQERLQHHQLKFAKSHTFYKPHETSTHYAYPIKLMIAAVVLLDCHSLLQIALGTVTWSIDYRVRPEALTATILSVSITTNICAGIVISIGDKKTRKKDVFERMFRQALTEEAMSRMEKDKERQQRKSSDEGDGEGEGQGGESEDSAGGSGGDGNERKPELEQQPRKSMTAPRKSESEGRKSEGERKRSKSLPRKSLDYTRRRSKSLPRKSREMRRYQQQAGESGGAYEGT